MRYISPNIKLLSAYEEISVFYLSEIALTNNDIFRETNLAYPIEIPGYGVFSPSTGMISFEAPRLSSAVDRETYKITYIDPEFRLRAAFEAGLTGAKVRTGVGFFNTTSGNMTSGGVSVLPGEPLLGAEDIIIAYSGRVDTQGYSIEPDSGTVIAVLEGASPMASLEMTKSFYTSKESMGQVNAADTAFDEIFIGAAKVSYSWGRAAGGSGNR